MMNTIDTRRVFLGTRAGWMMSLLLIGLWGTSLNVSLAADRKPGKDLPLSDAQTKMLEDTEKYREGHGVDQAIVDFTAVIESKWASSNEVAVALIGRGRAYQVRATASEKGGTRDAKPLTSASVQDGLKSAIDDFTKVINSEETDIGVEKCDALFLRGDIYAQQNKSAMAIADYKATIADDNIYKNTVVKKLNALMGNQQKLARWVDVAACCAAILEVKNISDEEILMATLTRGVAYLEMNDREKSLADLTAVVNSKGLSDEMLADALLFRGEAYELREPHVIHGDLYINHDALNDFSKVIATKKATREQIDKAKFLRARNYEKSGMETEAYKDFASLGNDLSTPPALRARALMEMGRNRKKIHEYGPAIVAFTSLIQMSNPPRDLLLTALVERSNLCTNPTQYNQYIADCEAILRMPEADETLKRQVRENLAKARR